MTADPVKTRQSRPEAPARRVLLNCDAGGDWTLSGQDRPAPRFSDFDTALKNARRLPEAQAATIEVWQSGEYICCLPPEEWPHRASAPAAPIAANGRVFTAVERWANRAAEVLMVAASAAFWLALMGIALAASLGWRLAFF